MNRLFLLFVIVISSAGFVGCTTGNQAGSSTGNAAAIGPALAGGEGQSTPAAITDSSGVTYFGPAQ